MRLLRSARFLLLALLLSAIPASSFAGVFISVGFAPPVLPVYVQPVCPEPGLMWTPGYWAYGPDGYYWVPGTWVPAPYIGALWTPGFWGWNNGLYVFHDGYWGRHIGYYGGVNYGFGYGGIGFAGGVWRGGFFAYNSVVMHVGVGGGWGNRVYEDRVAVDRGFVARDSHVAFSGGPGGIQHQPVAEERVAERDQHAEPTRFQQQHIQSAQADKASYARNNGGRPQNLAVARPLAAENHPAPTGMRAGEPQSRSFNPSASAHTQVQTHGQIQQSHPAQLSRPETMSRPTQQSRPVEQPRMESRPAPAVRPAPESHAAPQVHSAPRPEPRDRGHR